MLKSPAPKIKYLLEYNHYYTDSSNVFLLPTSRVMLSSERGAEAFKPSADTKRDTEESIRIFTTEDLGEK